MIKPEFSEAQFMFGYTKELTTSFYFPYKFFFPTAKQEKDMAADLIIHQMGLKNRYRFSEFYQFKRSNYYNHGVFDSIKKGPVIDTSVNPMHGFKIYNSRTSQQFNLLKEIAKRKRTRVYYCAPLFHTYGDFFVYFQNQTILENSKVFDLKQPFFQNINIRLDSNHKILFDKNNDFVCSAPYKIKGEIALSRDMKLLNEYNQIDDLWDYDINELKNTIHEFINIYLANDERFINHFRDLAGIHDMAEFLLMFNIYWLPFFEGAK